MLHASLLRTKKDRASDTGCIAKTVHMKAVAADSADVNGLFVDFAGVSLKRRSVKRRVVSNLLCYMVQRQETSDPQFGYLKPVHGRLLRVSEGLL